MANLSTKININRPNDKVLIGRWSTIINNLDTNHVVRIATINGTTAEKYRLDFNGLLKELGITDEFLYPHIRVNGYKSSDEYTGDNLNIKILDSSALSLYYNTFIK